MSDRRKALGNWGERCLDTGLAAHGWHPVIANRRFRGGEIDRIYQFDSSGSSDASPSPPRDLGASEDCETRVSTRMVSLAAVARETFASSSAARVLGVRFCVAEVKTLRVRRVSDLQTRLGGDFLSRSLCRRQCRHLALCARLLAVRGVARVHVRIFRVFVFADASAADVGRTFLIQRFAVQSVNSGSSQATRVRVVDLGSCAVAVSFQPEFVPRGQASHPLQISLD